MNGRLAVCGVISLSLHAAGVVVMMPHKPGAGRAPAVPPSFEVEMVNQTAAVRGGAAVPPVEAAPPPRAAAPPDPGPPPDPPPDAAPQSRAAPQMNLSGADEDREALSVTGDFVVPARPDGRVQNKAPAYPPEAARRGSQGLVGLVIHVTESGTPAWVDIRVSSGDAVLDNAARDAVSAWRFQPAREGGAAVPFDFSYNIIFALDGRGRSVSHGSDRSGYDPRR